MSDSDKRQTRQRVLTIGACAAIFAFGGPLISQRFGDQKAQEAYRADAIVLARSIAADRAAEGQPGVRLVSFNNSASPEALLRQAARAGREVYDGNSARARDNASLRGLASFTLDNLGSDKARNEQDELDCLSEAVYYEARSEDTVGQMAVAEVVMNRMRDPRFPKTVCAVVYQGHYRDTGCQFTFTCDGSLGHKPKGEAWDRARAVALHVLLGLAKPVTNKATHYHTDYVNPYWKAGMVETEVIGTHIFYRFPKTTAEWTTARIALQAQELRDRIPEEAPAGLVAVGIESPADPVAPAVSAPLITVSAHPAQLPTALVPATEVADARPL